MAEETPVVQNWRLLVVAVVLGLIVAIIYNVHIRQIRETVRGDQVMLLQVTKDLQPGEQIKGDYLLKKAVPKTVAENMGNPMQADAYDYAITQTVNSIVRKDSFLSYSNVTRDPGAKGPLGSLTPGMDAFTIAVDSRMGPAGLLRPEDHVNILGVFTLDSKTSNYVIMEGVRVFAIDGHTAKDAATARGGSVEGWSTFKTITIEVSPSISLQLSNVLSHASNIRVVGRNPNDEFPANPQINTKLSELAKTSAGGGRTGGTE